MTTNTESDETKKTYTPKPHHVFSLLGIEDVVVETLDNDSRAPLAVVWFVLDSAIEVSSDAVL